MLAPGARTVTAALRVMGLSAERHFTHDHRVLNRATWSGRHASRMLLGLLLTCVVPSGATVVLGADDTVERRSGRKIRAKGCYRDAVRSSQQQVLRCFGLKWVSLMRLVPVPWSRRVGALPFVTALCWPAKQPGQRRHKTSVDWVRQMMKQARRWLPGSRVVLVLAGGFSAVSLALADFDEAARKALQIMDGERIRTMLVMSPPRAREGPDTESLAEITKRYGPRLAMLGGGGTLNPMLQE
ncbi:MAG: transposase, partial [Candidatus Entotheonellia bacterium]